MHLKRFQCAFKRGIWISTGTRNNIQVLVIITYGSAVLECAVIVCDGGIKCSWGAWRV